MRAAIVVRGQLTRSRSRRREAIFPTFASGTALDSNATRFDGRSVPQKRPTDRDAVHSEMIKETNLQRNCQSLLTLQSVRLPPAPQRDTFHLQPVWLCSIRKSRAAAGPGPERKKAACHHSNSQHSQSGVGLHSCFPGTMKPALGEPQQITSHRSLRSCEENRQTELVVVPRSVALGVVHRGDVHLAWAQLRIRNRHHRVAAFVDCGHQP